MRSRHSWADLIIDVLDYVKAEDEVGARRITRAASRGDVHRAHTHRQAFDALLDADRIAFESRCCFGLCRCDCNTR